VSHSAGGHYLADVPLFAGLNRVHLNELAERSPVHVFRQGEILCLEGDPGHDLLVLETGQLRISRFTMAGQEVVLATVEPPATVGELALLDGTPRSATITAQRTATVRLVPRSFFLQLIHENPVVTEALLRTLAGLVRAGNDRHMDVVGLDAHARLAKWLLVRAAGKGTITTDGTVVPLDRTQGELAAELGITRVWLNRALKDFERSGLLRKEDQIVTLLQPALLMQLIS